MNSNTKIGEEVKRLQADVEKQNSVSSCVMSFLEKCMPETQKLPDKGWHKKYVPTPQDVCAFEKGTIFLFCFVFL